MYNAYLGIVEKIPLKYTEGNVVPYGGVPLRMGAENEYVFLLQEYLNYISQTIPEVLPVPITGYFGVETQNSVISVQHFLALNETGSVDLVTWNAIISLYNDLYNGSRFNDGQYPGYNISA